MHRSAPTRTRADAMGQLVIRALGTLQVTLDGAPITRFESDKARALLLFLAIESDRPHRRDVLSALLWPEFPEAQALQNLRRTIHRLRRALGDDGAAPPLLLITTQTIQLHPDATLTLDVAEFRAGARAVLANDAATPTPSRLAAFQQVSAFYAGDFLGGALLANTPDFEAWSLALRDELRAQAQQVLERLVRD